MRAGPASQFKCEPVHLTHSGEKCALKRREGGRERERERECDIVKLCVAAKSAFVVGSETVCMNLPIMLIFSFFEGRITCP